MSNEKSITVTRDIPAPATKIFAVLADPSHHVELDGSGFVQGVDQADRITRVGQTFRMNMAGDHMGGDYQTDNVVTGLDPGKLLAWKTAPAGSEPPGWEWVWQLDPQDADSTSVSLTYDWEKVTDPDILSKVSFPLVSETQLDDSLNALAEVVSGQ